MLTIKKTFPIMVVLKNIKCNCKMYVCSHMYTCFRHLTQNDTNIVYTFRHVQYVNVSISNNSTVMFQCCKKSDSVGQGRMAGGSSVGPARMWLYGVG